jgi:two-component system chemotaxis sensor kinase CheA
VSAVDEGPARVGADHGVVHVHLDRLDVLLNQVGELVINRAALVEAGRRARSAYGFKEQVLDLVEAVENVGRIADEIRERVIKARMVPVEQVFDRFRSFVEDLSLSSDKQIELVLSGGATEIDKKVIDELAEPLVHLVRNAVDHGLETAAERELAGKPERGTVTLSARHEGNSLVIEVEDDGAGVDLEAVRRAAEQRRICSAEELAALDDRGVIELLFHPSFSTSTEVTGMSGRGVGLDAARKRIELLGGALTMESRPGRGTRCRIRLPITMAIIPALMLRVGAETYAIPVEHVEETVRARASEVETVESREVLELRGEALPLARLSEVLEVEGAEDQDRFYVVVVRSNGYRAGLVVDRVLGRQEIVVKPIVGLVSGIEGISGATIAGDGSVFLIPDVPVLCQQVVDAVIEDTDAGEAQGNG